MPDSPFSPDFATARERFLAAARGAKAEIQSYDYPVRGPRGEALATDVAWIGPRDARKVFVTVSGTHGVEGFCGSAAQIDWLKRGEASRLSRDMAAMLVHAINPYGFAWLRRVTHENVDLNRNWVDFSQERPRRADYDELAAALCPDDWTDQSRAQTQMALQSFIQRRGFHAFVEAVTGGQYHHPRGLFFGGTEPCAARLTLERIFTEHLARAERIGIIDFHSGLGPTGFGELMTTARGSEHAKRAQSWYGAAVIPVGSEESSSAQVGGDWISATAQLLPHATVTAIAIEFGTVAPLQVLNALRADNWLHVHGDPAASWPNAIKKEILGAFLGDDDLWRGMILGQSLAVTRQAVAGLQL
jgi:Protein of unknown function (DUF2817)